MSPLDPLEILQLVGYSVGAVLPLWMAIQLVSHRSKLTSLERMLALLALTMGGWHTSNLVITLHSLFDLGYDPWTTVLRIADTVSVVSITFAYSFLLHVHLHLWANAHSRPLTRSEQLRVYLSYLPTVFLALAIPLLWKGEYAPMFVKLRFFVILLFGSPLGRRSQKYCLLLSHQIAVNADHEHWPHLSSVSAWYFCACV
jgi:hypothetical protein